MAFEWDETLYTGAAAHYRAGRMPYPPLVAEAFARELGLDGTQRLLDVGCGPGSLTALLAPRYASVVGVDADPGMLAEAPRLDNVRWVQMRAEELPGDLGTFDTIVFAQSFHWLDRPAVARVARAMLRPGGTVVHVGATTHRGDHSTDPLEHPRPPHARIEALVQRYLGPHRRAGASVIAGGPLTGEDDIFRAAGFAGRSLDLPTAELVTRTEDDIVAATFSLSSATPHLFGERAGAFEADLRALLRRTSPGGVFSERTQGITLTLWRP